MLDSSSEFKKVSDLIPFPFKMAYNKMALNSYHQTVGELLLIDSKSLDMFNAVDIGHAMHENGSKKGTPWQAFLQECQSVQDNYNYNTNDTIDVSAIMLDQALAKIGLNN